MQKIVRLLAAGWLAANAAIAWAQSTDDAALDLKVEESAPSKGATTGSRGLRLFGEVAYGALRQRNDQGSVDARRASLDLYWEFQPATGLKGVLSNRLDDLHPVDAGNRSTLNSLREAYLGWVAGNSQTAIDAGRINLRNGPAYGFNPTDYFRAGTSRAVTSADPLALRENRLGVAMFRVQQLWEGGSLSLALAPELSNGPSNQTFSADWGATNNADRALVTLSYQLGSRTNLQGLVYHHRERGTQVGINATSLVGDSVVGFLELSSGKDWRLLDQVAGLTQSETKHRATLGLTYTTATKLSLTGELEYNGFAPTREEYVRLGQQFGAEAQQYLLYLAQDQQDVASRKALLLYATQKDAFLKNLDVTALLRRSLTDQSSFAWVEARYHWPKFDLALQWQANLGRADSEYGSQSGSRLIQILAVAYF